MIEVCINGNNTIREENEIYREFVESRQYDFVKSPICGEPREAIRDWLSEKGYAFKPDDKIIVELIACKL